MPTISCSLKDLNALMKTDFTAETLDQYMPLIKAEMKGYDPATDELRVELQDTNRPDLWCVEGIARQIQFKLKTNPREYAWFETERPVAGVMKIHPEMAGIRPFAAAFAVRNLDVSEDLLIASIQSQEKLAGNLGRNRQSVSIGIYDLNQIEFPVHYTAVGLDDVRFVPLGYDTPMTPRQILEEHPKGIEYRSTLQGFKKVPMLMDAADGILSFPPIINSRNSGEVKVGRRDLFVEATGTHLDHVLLALNILAANFADRGGTIDTVTIEYPYATDRGTTITVPVNFHRSGTISPDHVEKALGKRFSPKDMATLLTDYGYRTRIENGSVTARLPDWRQDLMHPVDIVEDIAICAGYEQFEPEMPRAFTVGKLSDTTLLVDIARLAILPMGFEEVILNVLCNPDEFTGMMREPDRSIIRIKNPMTENFSALRDRLMPSLLRVLRDSSSAVIPHRIFEAGEVTVFHSDSLKGLKTFNHIAALISDKQSEFATAHSYLDAFIFQLGLEYRLVEEDRPEFIPGRSGRIVVDGQDAGWIGEIHPEVLENFSVTMPTSGFELNLEILLAAYPDEGNSRGTNR